MSDEWVATYRLQVHAGFDLDAAAARLPYLAALGVSHVYLSPCLQAVPGSLHGYDVTDPTTVSADLGGEAAWTRFIGAARSCGLGVLLDIVPNHMAACACNSWWDDVLAQGPYSSFASYFDFCCDARSPWRVQIAVLSRPYGAALRARELAIVLEDGLPRIRHFTNTWPLCAASWRALVGAELGDAACFRELERLQQAASPEAGMRAAHAELAAAAKRILAEAHDRGVLPGCIERINGDEERLHEVLSGQYYRLHGWEFAGELTNYRRFFDVSSLVGIRIELPEVFAATHRRIEAMIRADELAGLRIDHPDGLRDPREYFRRLRRLMPDGRIYLEKILENDEHLAEDWPVDGTVGYEFLAKVNRLWMDDQRAEALTAIYSDFTGHPVNLAALVPQKKRAILESALAVDLERLTTAALRIAKSRWQTLDMSRHHLREALARITTALPVYRTYRTAAAIDGECRRLLGEAVQHAAMAAPDIDAAAFEFLGALLIREPLTPAEAEFVAGWQQLSPAVMAKGVEDTIFYCFDRLVSCNEVGSQASLLGISTDKFHEFCHTLGDRWPNNLLATSTHDNKRSEDVRTRISVLSEIPERWSEALHLWSRLNSRAWGQRPPDRHAEYLLYQTLIGAWPIDRERCWQYLLKACREAKIMTSWQEPDQIYEESIQAFVDGVYASAEFISSLERFIEPLRLPGRINSLAQTLIKMTAPGVPDFYQGAELWDLSLVDPDNRRAVDFDRRASMLDGAKRMTAEEAARDWDSGMPKLWMIARVLELRRRRGADFSGGSRYQPLVAQGQHLGKLFAFQRGAGLVTVVPRFTTTRGGTWADTRLPLPDGRWRNCFTDAAFRGEVAPAELFGAFPVGLLVREDK
jgi:(1->4)-alpha-D-glucan 1-alpha-D-glucosylmutase